MPRPNSAKQSIENIIDLGRISYGEAYLRQQEYVTKTMIDGEPRLILCEHTPVLTLGRMFKEANLHFSREEILKKGIQIYSVDRGGDVTLHNPGQLVVYPILDLTNFGKDLHTYLHQLEDVGIAVLKSFNIDAGRDQRNTGLWIGDEKIMAAGIGVKKWISYHGISLNVNNDLNLFSVIRPCGLNFGVTSMQKVAKKDFSVAEVQRKYIDCFCKVFHLECGINN